MYLCSHVQPSNLLISSAFFVNDFFLQPSGRRAVLWLWHAFILIIGPVGLFLPFCYKEVSTAFSCKKVV
jgi:hypothetical protein